MSPHFVCHDCGSVNFCEPKNTLCPFCHSSNGHIISNEEFREQHDTGAIKTIDPRTKKPFKKDK
jgi:uncharacterized OB-fold protein